MTQSIPSVQGLVQRLGLVSMVVPMTTLSAQSVWVGTTSANWSTAANWNPGIPAEGDNITISDTTTNGLTLDDASHLVGSITVGTTGTRTSGFTLANSNVNTLTIAGGVIANGNFTAGIGTRIRGKSAISADQTWQIGGQPGDQGADRGIAINEVAGSNTQGSFILNGTLNKSGTGQLTMGAVAVTGSRDINVNEGSLKLNAGGSLPLTIAPEGTAKIAVNNSATLIFSQNSGSYAITRPIQFNNTSKVVTGSGSTNKSGTFEIGSNMEWNGIHTITTNRDGANTGTPHFRFSGVMSGAGSITKDGAVQLILGGTAANTLSGTVTVAAGELVLDKTGVIAVPGNISVTGGVLRIAQPNQIADSSSVTVSGTGQIGFTANRPETIASLAITSSATSSVSGLTVTGATTISGGTQELNSGQVFTTNSLAISNNAALRPVGNATAPLTTDINIGAGGLSLTPGRILLGNAGNDSGMLVNLGGDLVSTGASQITAANQNGPRLVNLQGATRAFAVNDGTLVINANLTNGAVVKSGAGTLALSQPGSTADLSVTEGNVRITGPVNAGNLTLSGGSLLMDVAGDNPATLTTSGDFTATGGTIEISADNGPITPGVLELVRYNGTLTGTPVINIPPQLAASRMAPVIDLGTGTADAITLTSTDVPLELTWRGTAGGGVWNNTTANFNGGTETFFPLDSVIFDGTGTNTSVVLNTEVFPTAVTFNHGPATVYQLTGSGSIAGPASLTKDGAGTTVIATDNTYTGPTDILAGTLQIGNGGLTGSVGTGAVAIAADATLAYSRDGLAVVPNVITGIGTLATNGPGTVAFTANNDGFLGGISVNGGTFQLGDGGADGSFGTTPVTIGAGAAFAIKRTGTPTVANSLMGAGRLEIIGGSPIVTGFNTHTGGVRISEEGIIRAASETVFGEFLFSLDPDAIILDHGGLKNQDSFPLLEANRGITIAGEAYFTAGWTKSLTIEGPITGTGNVFINHDSGTVVFGNESSNWNGILTLGATKPGASGTTGGFLEIRSISNGGQPGPLGIASADPANLVFNGGRLIYTGLDGSTDRGFTLEGNGSINVFSATLAMSGKATGPGALTKIGDGVLTLSGDNDFAGNVVVDDGALDLRHTNALGATAKTLVIAGDAGGSRIPEVRLSGGISPTVADLDISGAGLGNLTGALHNVSGNNTLTVTNDITLRTGNGNTTLYSSAGLLTVNTPLVTANATNRQLILAGEGDGVLNATVANGSTANLPLVKNGPGTWELNGTQTYTGTTTVNAGVLSLGQAGLNDAAAVVIAADGKLNLDFTGTDRVGSLTINGELKADGVYDAANSDGFITGAGSIRVGVDPNAGFESWVSSFPFGPNDDATENGDPDGDGISNLLEYVLGGVPVGAGASNTGILPDQNLTDTHLEFTFFRSDLSESDVTLKVQWSEGLGSWDDFATIGPVDALPAVEVTEDAPTAELDTVTVSVPRSLAASGRLFVRLMATKN